MGWGLRPNKKAKVSWVTNIHLSLFSDCGCHFCLLVWSPCLLCHERMGCIYKPKPKPFFLKLVLPVYFFTTVRKAIHQPCSMRRGKLLGLRCHGSRDSVVRPGIALQMEIPSTPCYIFLILKSLRIASWPILLVAFQADVPKRSILLFCFPFTPWSRKSIKVETTLHL